MVHEVDNFMNNNGSVRCFVDHWCYTEKGGTETIILLQYVDDMLIDGPDENVIKELKEKLSRTFEIKYLGASKKILGC